MMRLAALALLSQSVRALYTFHQDESYNTSQGLQQMAAWGTVDLTYGVNLSEQQPTFDLKTPLKWLLTVDADGEQNLGLAAPHGPIGPTNSTPIFEGEGAHYNYSWAVEGGCAFELPLSLNSIENGQQDQGDCQAVLGPECTSSLLTSAYETGNTNDWQDYDEVCSAVASQLQQVILAPKGSCQRYFDGANKTNYQPIVETLLSPDPYTTENIFNTSSPVLPGYQVLPLWSGKYNFSKVDNSEGVTITGFDSSVQAVKALILMFQPPNTNSSFAAYMNCVKVEHLPGNATVTRDLPRGTPVPNMTTENEAHSHRITGIATGTAFGSVSTVCALVYFLLRYRQRRRDERLRIRDLEQRLAETRKGPSLDSAFQIDKAMLDGAELNEMDASPPDPLPLVGTARSELVGTLGFKELEDSSRRELCGCEAAKELENDRESTYHCDEGSDDKDRVQITQTEMVMQAEMAELPGDVHFWSKPSNDQRPKL